VCSYDWRALEEQNWAGIECSAPQIVTLPLSFCALPLLAFQHHAVILVLLLLLLVAAWPEQS
jgi:hypothetical protein